MPGANETIHPELGKKKKKTPSSQYLTSKGIFRNEEGIKTFADKPKLKEFSISRLALHEMLKVVL